MKKTNDNLEQIKGNIKEFRLYFDHNYNNYNHFRKIIFQSSLTENDITLAQALKKPILEFNTLEAVISRLRGEFSKQEPSVRVRESDDAENIDPNLVKIIEDHERQILYECNKDNLQYDIYTDILSGGFSAVKVFTDYKHELSMEQNIFIKKVFDPTLTGFDKLAQASHKGDGRFCFEIFPRTKEEFENEFNKKVDFYKSMENIDGFKWFYSNGNQDIVLVCDYYEKKIKKEKIVLLSTGETMKESDYEMLVEHHNKFNDVMIQMPAVVKSRKSDFTTICRYRITGDEILEYVETDYRYLPIIFIDGNSVVIKDEVSGQVRQVTRSYVQHAEGIQRLKNFAGSCLANELENTVQHKVMAPKEGIPPEYKDAYINIQNPSVLVYNQFNPNNPMQQLNPPSMIARTPIPPEISNTFASSDQIMQSILGNYDSALGINDNELSGKAISAASMNSNAASVPYTVGYLKGLNRILELVTDLIPKYYKTQRTLPVRDASGKSSYAMVNSPGTPQLHYSPNALSVNVEAGVNFEIQRERSFQMLIGLMNSVPLIAQYIGQEENGIEMLLDNIDIRGIDGLKQNIAQFVQQNKQMQQQQQQMQSQMAQQAQQNSPAAIKQMELQQKAQSDQMNAQLKMQQAQLEAQLKAASIAIDKQNSDIDMMLAVNSVDETKDRIALEAARIDAQNARSAVEVAISHADHEHSTSMDVADLHHRIRSEIDREREV